MTHPRDGKFCVPILAVARQRFAEATETRLYENRSMEKNCIFPTLWLAMGSRTNHGAQLGPVEPLRFFSNNLDHKVAAPATAPRRKIAKLHLSRAHETTEGRGFRLRLLNRY